MDRQEPWQITDCYGARLIGHCFDYENGESLFLAFSPSGSLKDVEILRVQPGDDGLHVQAVSEKRRESVLKRIVETIERTR